MRSSRYLVGLSLTIAVLFLFVMAQSSLGQVRGIPKLYGEFKMPEVGAYVTYKVINKSNEAERITKLSIVGIEKSEGEVQKTVDSGEKKKVVESGKVQPISKPKGEDLFWYEVEETDPKTGMVTIIKMLISGNPQDIGTIHRMITKSGKETATELPPELMQMINQIPVDTAKTAEPDIKTLGTEKVMIGKKSLKCTHVKYTTKDKVTAEAWTNEEIPLFGVVKSDSPEQTMELIDYGKDAKTAITEEPELLDMGGIK
jgi:hypothetical protein